MGKKTVFFDEFKTHEKKSVCEGPKKNFFGKKRIKKIWRSTTFKNLKFGFKHWYVQSIKVNQDISEHICTVYDFSVFSAVT